MPACKRFFFLFSLVLVAPVLAALAQGDVELDIDSAIAKVENSLEDRKALEESCIAVLAAEPAWPELYRAVRILGVIGSIDSIAPLAALLQEEKTVHLALLALEPMPYPEVDAALRDAFSSAPRKAQLSMISAMAARKDKDAVPLIAAMMASADVQMLDHAIRALGVLGGAEAETILDELLRSGDAAVEVMASEGLLLLADGLVQEGKGERAADLYQRLLGLELPDHIRAGAFEGLLRAVPVYAPDAVLQAIQNDDLLLRRHAVAAVAQLPNVGVTARVSAELMRLPEDTQAPLLESLSRRDEPIDQAFLFSLLEDEREEVRLAAMRAIADHGDTSAIEPLARLLSMTESRPEKQAAIETLRRIQGDGMEASLIQFMANAPAEQRPDLIEALVQRRAVAVVDALMLQAAEPGVRAAAFRGLGQLADAEHLDSLLALLSQLEGEEGRPEAEAAVVALVRNIGVTAGELVITKALYGDLPDGEHKDVTRAVQKSISEGALSVVASNDIFGDTAPNVVKTLHVEYVLNGVPEKRDIREGGTLNIVAEAVSYETINRLSSAMAATQNDEGKASFLRIMGRLGGRKAYDIVLAHMEDPSVPVREAAIRTLSAWPDAFALPALADLFTKVEDASLRSATLRGCVRLLRSGAYSGDDSILLYAQLIDKAASPEELKLILAGVADLTVPEALPLVLPLLNNPAVAEEAALAVERIKTAVGEEAYQNIVGAMASTPVVDETFIPIFNGTDLDGWTGDTELWRVEDGCLVGETKESAPIKHNTFLIWEGGEVGDFDLKFRYRLESDWVNSGIQIRSEKFDTWRVRGYQPDISTEDWITGICYEEGGRGILARRGQKVVFGEDGQSEVEQFGDENALGDYLYQGDWNEYHIRARGNQFYTRINGHKMHEVIDNAPEARRSGILAFQLHAGPPMKIRITDIMLRRVAPSDSN